MHHYFVETSLHSNFIEIHSKMQQERITSLSGFVPLDSQTLPLLQMENTFPPMNGLRLYKFD